jgi:glycosyltransferase involved in cell wall biosynthesis
MSVSVIAPVLNERESIATLLDALLHQTVAPDEIIIADGGSTDGTREYLDAVAASERLVRVVEGPGGISENRNAAIAAAHGDIIACTDAGCVPQPAWLEEIVRPFDSGAKFVSGFFRPVGPTVASTSAGVSIMTVLEEVDPAHHVPAGNSQAFLKSAWTKVGGFPEGLKAAEDTLFGERMRLRGFTPVFAPKALVHWLPPPTILTMIRKAWRYGHEDGRARVRSAVYLRTLVIYWGLAGLVVLAAILEPLAALIPLAVLAGLVAHRTRFKYRWVQGRLLKYLFVPIAHVLQMMTQSLGWSVGATRIRLWYLRRNLQTRPNGEVLKEMVESVVHGAKRLIRPLIPEALFVKLRPRRHGTVRFNVDIVEASSANRRHWIRATPDTVRVRDPRSYPGNGPTGPVAISSAPPEQGAVRAAAVDKLGAEAERALFAPLSDPDTDVSILARVGRPVVSQRLALPPVQPLAIAIRERSFDEVAPWPDGSDAIPAVYARCVAAGHRVALTPQTDGVSPSPRFDPIAEPTILIFAVVPMEDVGGGSRSSQMAQELLARGYHVTYVSLFPVDETVDLGLHYLHPNLETYTIDEFRILDWLPRVHSDVRIAILELPHPRLIPLIERLGGLDFSIVYDLIDDWTDPSLGGWGYDPETERRVIAEANVLSGSAPALVRRLEDWSGRRAVEVPNGVNVRMFTPGGRPAPTDLPPGDGLVFEYHGSLYGDWFDWAGLKRLANAFRDARIVIIGDEKKHPPMPDNVHLLGLKPQFDLPAYMSHTDVALIPWEVRDSMHAVHPLKVSEYLAMGIPVAAPPLESLIKLPGVYTDADLVRAVQDALDAPKPDAARAAQLYGWGPRLDRLFEAAGLELLDDPNARPARIIRRPVVHYSESERDLT